MKSNICWQLPQSSMLQDTLKHTRAHTELCSCSEPPSGFGTLRRSGWHLWETCTVFTAFSATLHITTEFNPTKTAQHNCRHAAKESGPEEHFISALLTVYSKVPLKTRCGWLRGVDGGVELTVEPGSLRCYSDNLSRGFPSARFRRPGCCDSFASGCD